MPSSPPNFVGRKVHDQSPYQKGPPGFDWQTAKRFVCIVNERPDSLGVQMHCTRQIYQALRHYLLSFEEPEAKRMTRALPQDPVARDLRPYNFDVTRHLRSVKRTATHPAGAIMQALAKHCPRLCWRQSYVEQDFGKAFLENYGFLELLGTRGHFRHDELVLGILMLGPDTDYPDHYHEAEELYVPLSGTARWSRDHQVFVTRPPGTVIHHPSSVVHAIKTGSEPLVTAYIWTGGDLAQKSKIVGQQA